MLFSLVLFLNVSDVSATAENQTNTTIQSIQEQVTSQSTQEELVSTQSTVEQVTSESTQETTGENTQETDSTQSDSSSTSNNTTGTQDSQTNTTDTQSSQTTTETNTQTTENSTVTNNVNNTNSTASQVDYAAGTTTAKFTMNQVINAATWVKNYIETHHGLPDYVVIGGTQVNMPSFLKLLTNGVLQINNGTNSSNDFSVFNPAPVPRDSIKSGDMAKAEYLKIASDVKSFMDSKGVAPEYAYNTSLGYYLGYQNLVYMYAMILDSYKTKNVLPAYVSLKPWSLVTNPPVTLTIDQVISAASWVKNYVDTNHGLPDYVTIGTYKVSMSSFLELLTTSVLKINNGTGTTVDYVSFGVAPVPRDSIKGGDMAKAEYLKIASDVKSFMDSKGVAPEYAYNTSLGYYLGYQNLVYMYAKVLDSYKTKNVLPAYVSLKPWKFVSDPSILNFTIDQVTSAATWVKNYVDTNHGLPDYVTIGSSKVSMSSFLELLTTSVLQINNGTGTTVDYVSFDMAPTPRDSIKSGDMAKAEYLKIASDVKSFMDSKGVAPEYAYNTSLGLYLGYQSLVYMYAKILDSYSVNTGLSIQSVNTVLPAYVSLKPWSLVTNPPVSFTLDQIASAASWVKNYVDTNHSLPDYVTIGTYKVSMPSFLELLTTSVLQINNGTGTTADYASFGAAPTPRDEIHSGDMAKAEYLKIASDVKSFMDSKLVAPEYAYNTSLGYYLGYKNLVYMYATIMDSYGTKSVLPASVSLKPWTTFTLDQVGSAATLVTNYVNANHKLPDYVTIGSTNVNMPSFLEILTTAVLEVSNGETTPLYFMACAAASTPKDTIQSGNIYTAEYLKIAKDVKSFMDSKWVAPEYAYNTSLGTYLGYQNLVYMYAMLMDYNHRTGKIAEYAVMKPWSSDVPADLIPYTQPSANCQSDNAAIIALANSLTAGSSTTYDKAVNIFNWVRDNISYSFYYDTSKGAVGTLNAGSGNCCDTSHLLVALARAAGIPAEYVHGTCTFSSGTYGHVFARLYVNGTWYNADAISSRNYFGVINNWDTNSWTLNGIYLSLPF